MKKKSAGDHARGSRHDAEENPYQKLADVKLSRRTPMQHRIWLKAAIETFYPEADISTFAVSDGDRVRAAAIFVRRDFAAGSRLFLPGAEELGEPTELLFENNEAAEALCDRLARAGSPCRFGHYPAASPVPDALQKAYKGRGIVAVSPTFGSPFIDLDESWENPAQKFSKRRQGDFRRMQRKAEGFGEVRIEILSPDPRNVDDLLSEAIGVEAQSWKTRSGTSLAIDEANASFFRRYSAYASEAGILRIAFLRIDDEAVAMQIAVECDNAFWLFKIGYNETYHKCSPGNLLMLETVKYAATKKLATFEFLGKAAPWTKVWTEKERPNVRLRTYPFNPTGLAALASDGVAVGSKRLRERLSAMQKKNSHAPAD